MMWLALVVALVFAAALQYVQQERERLRKKLKQVEALAVTTTMYEQASLVDRFAERAMQVFMTQHGLFPTSLPLDYEIVAKAAYQMADAMLRASGRRIQ